MSCRAIEYINDLGKSELDSSELTAFINHTRLDNDKNNQKQSVEYLLRVIKPDLLQTKSLIESDLVSYSIDLQYTLKKYISAQQYRDAEEKSEKESDWLLLLSSIGGIPPVC